MALHSLAIRDSLISGVLPRVEGNGWVWDDLVREAKKKGYQDDMVSAVFPGGLVDAVAHYAEYTDRRMLNALGDALHEGVRVRDLVRHAVLARLRVLEDEKKALRRSLAFWSVPTRALHGQRVLYRTADRIWTWAGDTATDYNRYTKRVLLSSVLAATLIVFADDDSPDFGVTEAFLDRRIENVVKIGRTIGTVKDVIPNALCRTIRK